MSKLGNRLATPAEFTQALISAFGNMAPPRGAAAADSTAHEVALEEAPNSPAPTPAALPSTQWDPALLQQLQALLAQRVGPIAGVLVRRNAATCHDLRTLCERLADQVTQPGAGRDGTAQRSPASAGQDQGAIPDALVAASTKVLAGYLGPIASVVARRAAATAPDRVTYFGTIESTIADPKKRHAARTLLDQLH